jgi:flavin reductase (DIM6/NTAB) family NADH-FMN oxidoreductase RutF
MFYNAVKNDHGLALDPFKALIAPRPIGWISTVSKTGICNLAPYSYFNAFAEDPHYLAFGSGSARDGGRKGNLRNIEETGEFAWSLATFALREAMNTTSTNVPHGVDEFELAELEKAPSRLIKPPRVAASPASMECRVHQIVPLPDDEGRAENHLIIGRVLAIHIDDRFIVDGRVDTAAMRPIARLGYSEYATVEAAWRMRRPD